MSRQLFRRIVSVLVMAVLPGAAPGLARSDEVESPEQDDLEAWATELRQPSSGHQAIDSLTGDWDGVLTVRDGVDSKPEILQARLERRWILGSRFLREELTISQAGAGLYSGLGFIGYNNADGQYEMFWIDDNGTEMLFETGFFDSIRKVLITRGTYRDPTTGLVSHLRTEIQLSEPDRHKVSAWTTDDEGREYLRLEALFSRRK